ncbi:MAG: malate dehydrogenase [Coriobacteriaceae bacterium]|jgi:malate dehydrogenase|nr:malate dehydrogenase [Coriobacteriaceae bacterium]
MPKVTIVGAGNVGASAAHIIASKGLADIVLIDVAEGLPQGKALDMMHMRAIEGFPVRVSGTNDYADTAGSDIVVITAGIARKPGMTREDLLGVNAQIMSKVVSQAVAASPAAVYICVTNPLDIMTHLAYRESGLPACRLMGMGGVLDSSRLSFAVCEKLGCDPRDVVAWALGAHGEGMVCWPRFTTVAGTPLTELLDEEQIAQVVERTVKGGAEVVSHLKTGSAYYAPGASIARMVEAIVRDTHELQSVCAYLDGAYGIHDLYMNVPVRLGAGGVEEVVEFDLTEEELASLQASAASVRAGLAGLTGLLGDKA